VCDGLFWIKAIDLSSDQWAAAVNHAATDMATGDALLWHRRLGHLGFNNLANLAKGGLVTGLPVSVLNTKRLVMVHNALLV
jgi:GAG-pre-integrase domain